MGRISAPFCFLGQVPLYCAQTAILHNDLKARISVQVSLTQEPALYLIAICQIMAKLRIQPKFFLHKHFALSVIYHAMLYTMLVELQITLESHTMPCSLLSSTGIACC